MLEKYGDLLTARELLEILPIGKTTLYKLIRNAELKSVKLGGRYLVKKDALIKYLDGAQLVLG